MALKQISSGTWIETDALGAVTHTVTVKAETRIAETRILSKTGDVLHVHRTESPLSDSYGLRYANETHAIIQRVLALEENPSIEPDIKE